MVESYKFKSQLATAIGGIATIISMLGVNQLEMIFPQFGKWIPIIVAAATWYLSQTTENKRVEIAEQLVHDEYKHDPVTEYEDGLNDEYVTGDEDGS